MQALILEVSYAAGPAPLDLKEAEKAVRSLEHVHKSPRTSGWVYRYCNPDTGVECEFAGTEAGLVFRLETPRPTFFALEALPLAVRVARDLRREVILEGEPVPPSVETLLATWEACNGKALQEEASKGRLPPYCPPERLESLWEYRTLYPVLERRYRRRALGVPRVGLLQEKKTAMVGRFAVWEGLRPTVLPPVDWILLEDPPRPWKKGRVLAAEEVFEAVRRWLKEISQPLTHRIYEISDPPEELLEALRGLKGRFLRSFRELEVSEVVDRQPR